MARSLNRVMLIGNLGRDPEVRKTPQGHSVTNISIATSRRYKDNSGEWRETTEWHRIVLWDRLAEIAEKYLNKGSQVYIEGRLQTRNYEDKDNITRYVTEVRALNLILLGGRNSSSGDSVSDKESEYNVERDDSTDENEVPF